MWHPPHMWSSFKLPKVPNSEVWNSWSFLDSRSVTRMFSTCCSKSHGCSLFAFVSNAVSCSLPSQRRSWKRNLTGWPPQRAWESTLKQARMQWARHCSTGRLQRDTIWQTHCRACSPESVGKPFKDSKSPVSHAPGCSWKSVRYERWHVNLMNPGIAVAQG